MGTTERGRELTARIASATALAAVALTALALGPVYFGCLVAMIAGVMCWEWSRAVRSVELDAALAVHIVSALLACAAALWGSLYLLVASLAIAAIAIAWLTRANGAFMSALGVFYVGLPAAALVWMRQAESNGMIAILFLFAVVWAHDTFAMIVGKTFGGPRVWPVLSPQKTWSGVLGGLSAAALAGAAFAALLPDANTIWFALNGLLLGFAGFTGDLLESAFKRRYGLKNASGLIPGHGGALDRLDGVVVASVVAAIVALTINPNAPATSMLYWQ